MYVLRGRPESPPTQLLCFVEIFVFLETFFLSFLLLGFIFLRARKQLSSVIINNFLVFTAWHIQIKRKGFKYLSYSPPPPKTHDFFCFFLYFTSNSPVFVFLEISPLINWCILAYLHTRSSVSYLLLISEGE